MAGRIAHRFRQPARGQPTVALAPDQPMLCQAGVGIIDDAHASRLSPRQLLDGASLPKSLAPSTTAHHGRNAQLN